MNLNSSFISIFWSIPHRYTYKQISLYNPSHIILNCDHAPLGFLIIAANKKIWYKKKSSCAYKDKKYFHNIRFKENVLCQY